MTETETPVENKAKMIINKIRTMSCRPVFTLVTHNIN